MENLRAAIEKDLAESIEGEWKIDFEITYSDGNVQTMSANDATKTLGGQVLYFSQPVDPISGEQTIVNMPVVSVRITSLDRVPEDGEKCFIRMPISPVAGADKVSFVFTGTKAKEHGTDIGFIRIYPQKIVNENGPGTET